MIDPPKRTGYRLTCDAQMYYDDWKEYGGCRCFQGNAPCSSCTHDGHPISLEENDEAWELDYTITDVYNAWKLKQGVEMSRSSITDKGGMQPPKPQFKCGDKVRIVGNGNNHKQPLGKIVTLCEIHDRSMVSAEFASLGKPWGIEESYNTTLREQDIELVVEPKKDFVVGKWYKCVDSKVDTRLSFGKYYKASAVGSGGEKVQLYDLGYDFWSSEAFDVNSESDYDPNAKKVVDTEIQKSKIDVVTTGYTKLYRAEDVKVFLNGTEVQCSKPNDFSITKEDVNIMSTQNRVVSVKFFDDDAGLKAEHSLVAEYQVTTRVSDQMTISKVLLTEDVAGDIELHNGIRANTVDLHILKQTGNKVMLQPVEFEDLRVEVRQV